jgi:hypothetical protein
MGSVIRFPPEQRRRPTKTTDIIALFSQLTPLEQLAVTKAAEIVLVAREIMRAEQPPEE